MQPLHGSAGRLLPGMEYRIEPIEGVSEGGRLLVRGPNVMRGYLNPDANALFKSLGGWYDTGDIVRVDPEGFVHILGRLKRFAKISGEMVSLAAVEEALAGFPQSGLRCQVAVSRPDDTKRSIDPSPMNLLQLNEIRDAVEQRFDESLRAREVKFWEIPKRERKGGPS
jgi:acyl-[acyl-carrier-protein]-phospholipid O-acyltransferase/long-chain-fatty-acid--[acyl-carrier-protein] ligase